MPARSNDGARVRPVLDGYSPNPVTMGAYVLLFAGNPFASFRIDKATIRNVHLPSIHGESPIYVYAQPPQSIRNNT